MPRIAIVGAGPSAVYALKRLVASERPLSITVFEAGTRPGVGTPYDRAQNSPAMLANIASIELPPVCQTLLEWLETRPAATLSESGISEDDLHERKFFPRVILGDYFSAQFAALVARAGAQGHRVEVRTSTKVTDIIAHDHGVWIISDDSAQFDNGIFDFAILATGHIAPHVRSAGTIGGSKTQARTPADTAARLGILGTSLSGIDVAVDHALRIGTFVETDDGLCFKPARPPAPDEAPPITMMSRGGLLPEADFYCPIPYIPLDRFTATRLNAQVCGKDGDLDIIFALFLDELEHLDPAFVASLGPVCATPEGFAKCYADRRAHIDPFEWARANLIEARYNARHARTVPWRYALLRMHEPFGAIVKELSPDDRRRFNASLKRVFVDNYAAVPPLSIARLLALYDAGVLAIRALGADYRLENPDRDGLWHVRTADDEMAFDVIVDARGQAALGQSEFPFPTLRMQIRAQAIARLETLEAVPIGDKFELGVSGNPLARIFCLSLPFLLDRNPFIQGLTAARELGVMAAEAVLQSCEQGPRNLSLDELWRMLTTGHKGSIYLFSSHGQLLL